jgi:hypothetical protein
MKQVSFLTGAAGAAGLAPMAFGIAMTPTPAHAAAAVPGAAPASQAKRVSLHPVAGRRAVLTAALAASSSAAGTGGGGTSSIGRQSGGTLATGCKGTTKTGTSTHNGFDDFIWYWYKRSSPNSRICIGTVGGQENKVHNTGNLMRVRIWSNRGATHTLADTFYAKGHIASDSIFASYGVHRFYGRGVPEVQICDAWVRSSDHTHVVAPAICRSTAVG